MRAMTYIMELRERLRPPSSGRTGESRPRMKAALRSYDAATPGLLRLKAEREHYHCNAEDEGKGTDPPGEHQGSSQWRPDQDDAQQKGDNCAQYHPPTAMSGIHIECRAEQQPSPHKRPDRHQSYKEKHRQFRPGNAGRACDQPHNTFQHQKAPALLCIGCANRAYDGEDAVDEDISTEDHSQRQQDRAGPDQSEDAEQHAKQAADEKRPPIVGQNRHRQHGTSFLFLRSRLMLWITSP